jgi:hypothetical protein
MKRGCLTALVMLGLGVGALVAGYMYKYPNYTYRYRLTVNIEVDGKVHSGSSVIEVTWHGGPEIGDVGGYSPTLRGQAPLIDLGNRGVVVVALISKDWGQPDKTGDPLGALWIAPRAFGKSTEATAIPQFSGLPGPRTLGIDNLPRFLWFSDPNDPTTAQEIRVQDMQAILGPSFRFDNAWVENTLDPIVIDIRAKFPWLKPLEDKPAGSNIIYLPNKLGINRYLFIGDAS